MVAHSRKIVALIAAIVAIGALTVGGVHHAEGAGNDPWYEINLEIGEVDGYGWAVGARGPEGRPLDRICAMVSVVEPLRPDAPYVEGNDSVVCGSLARPVRWVAADAGFGSGDSSLTVLSVLFRPAVDKAILVFSTGERKVLRPRMAKIRDRQARGIPRFRYLAVPFKGDGRLRKVMLFDGKGTALNG